MSQPPPKNEKAAAIRNSIWETWDQNATIPNEEIVMPNAMPIDRQRTQEYFFDRKLSDVDPGDDRIINELVYFESFSERAKRHYVPVYLNYVLKAFEDLDPIGDPAVNNFLSFLESEDAKRLDFSQKQAAVICDLYSYLTERYPMDYLTENRLEVLLKTMQYWKARTT